MQSCLYTTISKPHGNRKPKIQNRYRHSHAHTHSKPNTTLKIVIKREEKKIGREEKTPRRTNHRNIFYNPSPRIMKIKAKKKKPQKTKHK